MMFLKKFREILQSFQAPIRLSGIITALTFTAILRTLIGLVPAFIGNTIFWCINI